MPAGYVDGCVGATCQQVRFGPSRGAPQRRRVDDVADRRKAAAGSLLQRPDRPPARCVWLAATASAGGGVGRHEDRVHKPRGGGGAAAAGRGLGLLQPACDLGQGGGAAAADRRAGVRPGEP